LDYFGREAYLAQSPQLYKQMAIAAGFGRVLEIAPAFRADPSFTSRHVTEITMLDVEMSPIASYEEVMEFEEDMLRHVFE
jgi:aspartyl/asparaginyl-tRNA synthetase